LVMKATLLEIGNYRVKYGNLMSKVLVSWRSNIKSETILPETGLSNVNIFEYSVQSPLTILAHLTVNNKVRLNHSIISQCAKKASLYCQ